MKTLWRFACALLVLHFAATGTSAGEQIDRIVASVNRQVILESELHVAMAYECLVNQTSCHPNDQAERQAALARLVDQRLLEQQMRQAQFAAQTSEEVAAGTHVREQVLGTGSQADPAQAWDDLLRKHGLTERDIAQEAGREVRILHFIDSRFRTNVRVEETSVESYYRDVLTAQLKAKGAQIPKLSEVSGRIRELLAQLEINRQLSAWLQSLREQNTVRYH